MEVRGGRRTQSWSRRLGAVALLVAATGVAQGDVVTSDDTWKVTGTTIGVTASGLSP